MRVHVYIKSNKDKLESARTFETIRVVNLYWDIYKYCDVILFYVESYKLKEANKSYGEEKRAWTLSWKKEKNELAINYLHLKICK